MGVRGTAIGGLVGFGRRPTTARLDSPVAVFKAPLATPAASGEDSFPLSLLSFSEDRGSTSFVIVGNVRCFFVIDRGEMVTQK